MPYATLATAVAVAKQPHRQLILCYEMQLYNSLRAGGEASRAQTPLPCRHSVWCPRFQLTAFCCDNAVPWRVHCCTACCRCVQGVLYTHRSNYLHALITVAPDMLALGAGGALPSGHQPAYYSGTACPLAARQQQQQAYPCPVYSSWPVVHVCIIVLNASHTRQALHSTVEVIGMLLQQTS